MKRTFYPIFAIILLLLSSMPAVAQESLSLDFQVGFDSFYKIGEWTPIQVTVANQGAGIQAELQVHNSSIDFGTSDIMYSYPLDLPSQSRKQFTLYFPLAGKLNFTIDLVDNSGNVLLSQTKNVTALAENSFLIGVLSNNFSLLNRLALFQTPDKERVAVAHLTIDDLPSTPQAWAGLDMLVINGIDTSRLTTDQQKTLANWVSFGGRLVVGGGPDAAQTIAGINQLLPFSGLSIETLPHPLPALERFSSTTIKDRGPYVAAVPDGIIAGKILVKEGKYPLIISGKRGLGQVLYLAFDLNLAPMDILAGRTKLLAGLTGQFSPNNNHLAHKIDQSRIRNSLAFIPGQTLPSPGAIAIYLLLYILIIGPLNYFILARLKRKELAWLTIPAIILLFSCYSYFSGFRLRSGLPFLRQITVIQTEQGTPLAEVTSFAGIFSPYRTEYRLETDGDNLITSLPNNFGVNSELKVTAGNSTTIENIRGDIGGISGIVAHSQTTPPKIYANLSYNRQLHRFEGTVNNDTGQIISQAHLIFGNQALDLGELPPGQTTVGGNLTSRYSYNSFYRNINLNDEQDKLIAMASRDEAIHAIFNFYDGNLTTTNRLYLTGWQKDSLTNINLINIRTEKISNTLLLIGLQYKEQ